MDSLGLKEAKSHIGLCHINKEVTTGNQILWPLEKQVLCPWGTMEENWQCWGLSCAKYRGFSDYTAACSGLQLLQGSDVPH